MPLPYTGTKGELNFEEDFVALLQTKGWEPEVLRYKTIPELIENWKNIIFERNSTALNNVPLSDDEMERVMDVVSLQANTPVKANHFINGRPIAILRDTNSKDLAHAGKEVYLDLFSAKEIAGGTSRYQIAEQTLFATSKQHNDARGDVTLLINGMPVIHIELKASGVDVFEAANQIAKYSHENIFRGFMGLVQVFWAINPEDALYFGNPGLNKPFNHAFFFRWGDEENNVIKNWRDLIEGTSHILSIPEAHKLIGYYSVADSAKDVLKICRSYQYSAIRAIVSRTSRQSWGDLDQLGGFVWCTTGGGKTLTSFKAGQLIIDMNLADKVVFVVDRKVLDTQSTDEYNSFARDGEMVSATFSSSDLFNKLKSNKFDERLMVTSIQKISRINDEDEQDRIAELNAIRGKRIVFIIDEAHRSQFGSMHEAVKRTFPCALFFGFTGTPIFAENMKPGELTTETVFGNCLSVYSLATGIRDNNVLGFWPTAVKTYSDEDLKEAVALAACGAKDKADIPTDTRAWEVYTKLRLNTPMASKFDEHGQIEKDKDGNPIKGIEDLLPGGQYANDDHRNAVVKNILENIQTISHGTQGTLFHGILATSSIQEACQYWTLFKEKAPELNVSALFDPSVDSNKSMDFTKMDALIEIVNDYNEKFETNYNRDTDPSLSGFKRDLIDRLSHKGTYKHIGNDHSKCVDIVIVVDQLLTGFDSQYINVLYMDKVMETDNLIQAISRTNRVYNNDEKPWGMVKFYRKPYTMMRNLKEALKLYCQGDYSGVEVDDIEENLTKMNDAYDVICKIFAQDNIENFVCLPKSDESRMKFKKEFFGMKKLLRAVMLQGFKWTNEYGAKLKFDKKTYDILQMRYNDLTSGNGGGGATVKPGFLIDTNISTMEMDRIDASYLEAQFKIVTMVDIRKAEKYAMRTKAMEEIEKNLGILSEIQQRYARMVLKDIQDDVLDTTDGKTFMQYIQEYEEKHVRESIHEYAEKTGVDEALMYDLYRSRTNAGIDELKLSRLQDTADSKKLQEYFNCSSFRAKVKLHEDLVSYIEENKADLFE